MSWLQNLSKIKDEVTNFATEVLAPDLPPDAPGASGLDQEKKSKEVAEQQLQELTNLCATQDAEVSEKMTFALDKELN